MDGSHAQSTRFRPKLSEATHVPPADRAESRWCLFIYFCSFLVLKIYDRTFATLLRLFTQAKTSAEKMILVMKGMRFSHYSTVVQVCARGNLYESSAAYNVHLQVPERGWDVGCYCSVIGQSQSRSPSDVLEGSVCDSVGVIMSVWQSKCYKCTLKVGQTAFSTVIPDMLII